MKLRAALFLTAIGALFAACTPAVSSETKGKEKGKSNPGIAARAGLPADTLFLNPFDINADRPASREYPYEFETRWRNVTEWATSQSPKGSGNPYIKFDATAAALGGVDFSILNNIERHVFDCRASGGSLEARQQTNSGGNIVELGVSEFNIDGEPWVSFTTIPIELDSNGAPTMSNVEVSLDWDTSGGSALPRDGFWRLENCVVRRVVG